jgi:thiamine kinase-like enzyme
MVTDSYLQFKAKLELALGFRQAGQGNRTNGQSHVSRALDLCPSLVEEIELLIPDWVMNQTWASPIDLAHVSLDVLPSDVVRAGHLRQHVLSQVHVAQAFEEYCAGRRARVAQHVFSGLRYDPSILRNRGFRSILVKSFLNHRAADLKPAATPPDPDESVPASIVGRLETTIGRAISNIERITTTKRRIYLIQAGERECILHLLEGGKDVLERRLALLERVRAVGVPAPAPLGSSLSLPAADHDPGWLLEERMVGSFFEPWNMSQTDQLKVVADLGRQLRRLHSVKVTGFGPILSAKLDAPYPTFDAWLSSWQEAVVRSCLAGAISELMLPTLGRAYRFLQGAYRGVPVLCHCELSSGNILTNEGFVSALIDWESAAGTDPAWDVANLFTTMSRSWYPTQDRLMLATFVQAYRPDDPDGFCRRVIAHRLLFVAGAITWLKQYGDEYYRRLTSILSDTKLQ